MNDRSDWVRQLDAVIDDVFPLMQEMRRHLHAHPEPSGKETDTAKFIQDRLQDLGLTPTCVADGCGVVADAPQIGNEPRIAVRADTDALHIQDTKQTEYSSRVKGVMHACGHDAHTAIVVGVAAAMMRVGNQKLVPWPLRWRVIFQPGEETNRGAVQMVADGALRNVAAILALHVDPSRPVGTIGTRMGSFTADCVELEMVVTGRGGHAARPHESFDPIAAVAQLISAIYQFIPRRFDSHEAVVVSFGRIQGGENPNVIPDHVNVGGTLRTLHRSTTETTLQHIRRLAQGIADASETQIEIRTRPGPPAVHNDPQINRLIESVARELVGDQNVQAIERPSMGGEDFANYLSTVPGAMFRLGCARDVADPHVLHSPKFDIDEESLRIGAQILARAVVAWNAPR